MHTFCVNKSMDCGKQHVFNTISLLLFDLLCCKMVDLVISTLDLSKGVMKTVYYGFLNYHSLGNLHR